MLPFFILSVLHPILRSPGWGEWTEWGDCDDEGLQRRARRCGEDPEAEPGRCQGNVTQSRPCRPHEVPGERRCDRNETAVHSCVFPAGRLPMTAGRNPVLLKFNRAQKSKRRINGDVSILPTIRTPTPLREICCPHHFLCRLIFWSCGNFISLMFLCPCFHFCFFPVILPEQEDQSCGSK